MSERVVPGPVQDSCGIREAVCIHTKKIYDSCRDKDCIEDLRVFPMGDIQEVLDRTVSLRNGRAELLHTYIDVEPATYNRGCYTVDLRYFYRITADAFTGAPRPTEVTGLAVFDKRVTLFGSEGSAKNFRSRYQSGGGDTQLTPGRNLPEAVVEAVDPIVLGMKVVDVCDPSPCPPPCPPCPPPPCPPCPPGPCCRGEKEVVDVPGFILDVFGNNLAFDGVCHRWYVTLGQFSIVRLERDAQLLIPMYDYCMPTRECSAEGSEEQREEDPCEVFRQIRFPVGDFFPPNNLPGMEKESGTNGCCCG